MNTLTTRKVLPTHPSQGEWVVINAADFDPAVHTEYVEPEAPIGAPASSRLRSSDQIDEAGGTPALPEAGETPALPEAGETPALPKKRGGKAAAAEAAQA